MKIHEHDAGLMTKMATTPTYGKNTFNIFPGTSGPISMNLVMNLKHRRLGPILFCSNDNPGLTLTYLTAMSNFATWPFI